jgi:acetoin utilization deacetylase AcuC-like enzyme
MFEVFDPAQLAHSPAQELHNGAWTAYAETPARAEAVLSALPPLAPARDFGMAPILAVHDAAYIDFLRSAHAQWRASGRQGDAIGYVWPVVARRTCRLDRIDALLGRYSFDAATPIGPDTWDAAWRSAQTPLTAAQAILEGHQTHAFALCRPPGHHAGRDYLGGYCYLNNAAIAAEAAVRAGRRVVILDLDYHHGNGTQDIFWTRSDVLFASIHADPATDYPFYWGHSDEIGEGAGSGATLNLPLPHGTTIAPYLVALDRAIASVRAFGADMIVLSFGADTFEHDPISHFSIRTDDFGTISKAVEALKLPTLIVLEGGYASAVLGINVASFLASFEK